MARRLTPPHESKSSSPRALTWQPMVAVTLAAVATFLLLPTSVQPVVRPFLTFGFAVSIGLAIRVRKPAYRAPWVVFATGLGFIAVGDVIARQLALRGLPVSPSWADGAYLVGVALLSVGGILLARRRTPGRWLGKVIDALIVAIGLALFAGVYAMTPHLVAHHDHDLLERSVAMAYPSFDMFLLTFLTLLLHAGRNGALRLVRGAVAALLVIDVAYLIATVEHLYQPGSPIDAGWVLVCGLVATAAWHPDMREAADPVPDRDRIGRARVVMLAIATVSFPTVLAEAARIDEGQNLAAVTATATVLLVLVFLRLFLVAGEASRLRAQAALVSRQNEFATMAAHELRTPLTSLRGSLSTLWLGVERGSLPASYQAELTAMALRQTDRLERLCRDLDIVVQSDAGGPIIELGPVAIADVARDVLGGLGSEASRVSVEVAPGVVAEADGVRLLQVVDNLVRNALQHAGGSAVAILAEAVQGKVVVEVVDGGPGLPAAIADAPFERFRHRGEGTTGGFGIGLWIVRELVVAMSGEVSYDGSNGGATFRVTLPQGTGRLAFVR